MEWKLFIGMKSRPACGRYISEQWKTRPEKLFTLFLNTWEGGWGEASWDEVRAKCHSCKAAYMHLHLLVRPINQASYSHRPSLGCQEKGPSSQLPPQRWGRGHTTTYTIPTTPDLNGQGLLTNHRTSLWGQASDGPWSHHTTATSLTLTIDVSLYHLTTTRRYAHITRLQDGLARRFKKHKFPFKLLFSKKVSDMQR